MAAYDDLNIKRIGIVSVISIVTVAVSVLAVQVLYFAMVEYVDGNKMRASDYRRPNQVLAEQAAELTRYGVNKSTGKITVPVELMMKKISDGDQAGSQADKSPAT